MIASTAVDLARLQFALTSIYHFLFVPPTLGLGPLVAIMQTLWVGSRPTSSAITAVGTTRRTSGSCTCSR